MTVVLRQPNPEILRIHVEDAGFVAFQRVAALEAPNYRLIDIFDLEERLRGHLQALAVGGMAAEEVLLAYVNDGDAEAAGTLLHVGLTNQRMDLIEAALAAVGEADPEDQSDVRAALARMAGWCSAEVLSPHIKGWLDSGDALLRWLALSVCSTHRVDPRSRLVPALGDADPKVRSEAARVAGVIGREDCRGQLTAADRIPLMLLSDVEAACAAASAETFPDDVREARWTAELFPLVLAQDEAQEAIRELLGKPETRRWGVVALGALGKATPLPWLVDAMEDPLLARVAGAALMQITGIYIAYDGLEMDEFPDDPDDPSLGGDPVEILIETRTPWPDIERMREWLAKEQAKFNVDERYLLGVPAWSISSPPEEWVKYQSRYRNVAFFQAVERPGAGLPMWQSPVQLASGRFGRAW